MAEPSQTIAYLFSRYPEVVSTFADSEMMVLSDRGQPIEIASVSPPPSSFRHGYARRIGTRTFYAPHPEVRRAVQSRIEGGADWPGELIERQRREFGAASDPEARARDAVYFAEQLPDHGIKHVHVHYAGEAAHTALFLKAMSGLPFSVTIHDHDWFHGLPPGLVREICHEATFLVCICEFTRDMVLRDLPDIGGKTHLIRKGVDPERFPRGGYEEGEELRILGVGPLNVFKGFEHLIQACVTLRKRGLAFQCELLGDGPSAPGLRAMVERHGLGGQIHLPGTVPQEEVARRLRGCDIFIHPGVTDAEGACDVLPVVLLEAMAAGKPVISTRLGGVPEAVADNETGLLVEPGDPDALARAVFAMLADHDMRRRFGHAARSKVDREFSIHQKAAELQALFDAKAPPVARPDPQRIDLACVARQWPDPSRDKVAADWEAMAGEDDIRLYSCRVPLPFATGRPKLLRRIRYLDDAMVLEADWIHSRPLAVRIEELRGELGAGIATETYLMAAKQALAMLRALDRNGFTHMHAFDSEALLVAWIVHRLSGIGVSATIGHPAALPDGVLRVVAGVAGGGRVATGAQRQMLGERFLVDPRLDATLGSANLLNDLVGRLRTHDRSADAGTAWLRRLRDWADASERTA